MKINWSFNIGRSAMADAVRTPFGGMALGKMWSRSATFLGAVMLILAGCGAPTSTPVTSHASSTIAVGQRSEAPPAVERLLRLMRDRLSLMHDVARSKWNAKRAVGDPERERTLLHEMEEKGKEHGLATPFTRAFFAAQIAAARRVQEAFIARWRTEGQGRFDDAPDLSALRQRIDSLNRELVSSLAEARPHLREPGMREQLKVWARQVLTGEQISEDVRADAIAPLVVQ